MTAIRSVLEKVKAFFARFEKKTLIILSAVTAVVLFVVIAGTIMLNKVEYTTLYSGLNADEAGNIMAMLQEQGVTAKVSGTDTILVPEKQADELRISLASQGYPKSGLNYDIFGSSSNMGSTDLERQTYLQYQLQENMRATISRMNKIDDCIVIVNLASKSSFVISNNSTKASVAVFLHLETGQTITLAEAKAIGEFVLKCVPDLSIDNISIVDSQMNEYDLTAEDGGINPIENTLSQQQLTSQMKETLTNQVLRVLEPAVGKGNVAVSVNLNLNFDKETVTSVEFSPPVDGNEEGLLRSSEELYEVVGDKANPAEPIGTDSNGVGETEYVYNEDNINSISESSSKIYNYELNEIQTLIDKAQGAVEDLSVAILVNHEVEGIAGNLDKVQNLVSAAIGVSPKYISAEAMPFVERASEMQFSDYFQQQQDTLREISRNDLIKTVIIILAIPLIAFIIIRLLRKKEPAIDEDYSSAEQVLDYVVGGPIPPDSTEIDIDQLLKDIGEGRSSETAKIEELIDKYPETVVQILRTWLSEEE